MKKPDPVRAADGADGCIPGAATAAPLGINAEARTDLPQAVLADFIPTVRAVAGPPANQVHHCGLCGAVHGTGGCPRQSEQPQAFPRLGMCGTCGRMHWSTDACPV